MAKKPKQNEPIQPNNSLKIEQKPSETGAQALAREVLEPHLRHAFTASEFGARLLGTKTEKPGLIDFMDHLQAATAKTEKGDLGIVARILTSQAVTLDSMFTELARRAALNMSEYVGAAESYGRLALKAQSNCRATLEALVKLHQPREQTVRHVHVNEGGQAVIADQVHNYAGVLENGKSTKQSLTTANAGAVAALPSPDPLGHGMPIPSREGPEAVPDARWHQPRSA